MIEFSIFGSCVSRDAVEFVKDAKVIEYYARQSVVSAASQMPDSQWLEQLRVDSGANEFYKRCIIDDFHKNTIRKIEAGLLKSSEKHKWGLAPYHYHDEYYLQFVEKLSLLTGRCDISAKDDFSLQKEHQ